MSSDPGREFIGSLARGISVINAFSAEDPEMTLSEVATKTALTRATARRVLLTLVELGYVRQKGRTFALLPKVLDLGYSYLSSFGLPSVAEPYLEKLVEDLHESSSMSVLAGTDIVYVARVPTSRIMTISLGLGSRLPAYPTSMGRVLLAGLPEDELAQYLSQVRLDPITPSTVTDPEELRGILTRVASDGFAIVDQELEEGLRSIAAPVTDGRRRVVAAVNVSFHTSRAQIDYMREEIAPRLKETASDISVAAQLLTRT